MRFLLALSTLATLLPFLASPTSALPAETAELDSRTFSKCKSNEYYWARLSICLPKTGIEVGVLPRDTWCPNKWNWHDKKKCCVPSRLDYDGPGKELVCPKGKWDSKKTCCKLPPPPPHNNSPPPQSHDDHKCKSNEYYWFRLSICLPKTGIEIGVLPRDKWCPKKWNWHDKKKCCVPSRPDCDGPGEEPECPKGKYNHKKNYCELPPPHNNPPPPPPVPSGKWGHGGKGHGHGKGHDNKGHSGGYNNGGGNKHGKNRHGYRAISPAPERRSLLPLDGRIDAGRCPKNLTACPATSAHIDDDVWECLNPQEELTSCGGCASLGQGQNCLLIPMAVSLTCEQGTCAVHSCRPGFVPSDGNSCVPVLVLGTPSGQTPL